MGIIVARPFIWRTLCRTRCNESDKVSEEKVFGKNWKICWQRKATDASEMDFRSVVESLPLQIGSNSTGQLFEQLQRGFKLGIVGEKNFPWIQCIKYPFGLTWSRFSISLKDTKSLWWEFLKMITLMVTLSYQMTIPSSPSFSLTLVASCVRMSIRVSNNGSQAPQLIWL